MGFIFSAGALLRNSPMLKSPSSDEPSPSVPMSNVPAAMATETAASGAGNDDNGMGGPGPYPDAIERARAAAADTVAQHLLSKAGRKGRAKNAGTSIPMGEMGNGAHPASDEEGTITPLTVDLEDGGEADIETEFLEAGAEMTTDAMNDVASTAMEVFAVWQLRDVERAAVCAQRVRMKEARENRIRSTIMRLAAKNPEKAARFFGALLYWDPAVWGFDVLKQFAAVAATGKKLREKTAPNAALNGKPAPAPAAAAPAPTEAADFSV